eukprot:TRINITY_DN68116_c0_g1_i1.p1 TRINITY_DN68116_c0_g1~~TRINITY_DN68116_c0_g1_i1.p1  ORF type:complete len:694 (+),score=103.16 TRINITY_DN68116_c0_g1_i1:49-2130(+)
MAPRICRDANVELPCPAALGPSPRYHSTAFRLVEECQEGVMNELVGLRERLVCEFGRTVGNLQADLGNLKYRLTMAQAESGEKRGVDLVGFERGRSTEKLRLASKTDMDGTAKIPAKLTADMDSHSCSACEKETCVDVSSPHAGSVQRGSLGDVDPEHDAARGSLKTLASCHHGLSRGSDADSAVLFDSPGLFYSRMKQQTLSLDQADTSEMGHQVSLSTPPRSLMIDRRGNARTSSLYRSNDGVGLIETSLPLKAPVFADGAAMKDKVRQAIFKAPYKVSDFYWDTGVAQLIARSHIFEQMTLTIIGANSLWIAIDTEFNPADVLINAPPLFIVAENFFCAFFAAEWLVRLLAFQRKLHGFKDPNFCFDSVMVVCMVVETWVVTCILLIFGNVSSGSGVGSSGVLRLIRLLRLTRMARMARLLRAMPELMILLKAIFVAFRSVFFTICLLIIIIYVFAIAFVQLTENSYVGQQYFSGVFPAMGTLLLAGNLPDHYQFVSDVTTANFFWGAILMVFIFLAPLTVMGMLAGVLVEVVSVVSSVEKETMVVSYVTEQLQKLLDEVDEDNNKRLTREEFQHLIVRPDAARMMASVGVDVVGLAEYCDFLFADNELISFGEFIELVLQLRGTNQATVKDIVDMRKFMKQELSDTVAGEVSLVQERLLSRLPELVASAMHARPRNTSSAVPDPPVHAW